MIVVLMGVSGSGKTTIGMLMAQRTGCSFADADDYHSAANKQKMGAGHPLNDGDRQPWLEALNAVLRGWAATNSDGVLACSALKAKYRETLESGMARGTVHFVLLDGSPQMLAGRLAGRHHEYMTGALLESQLQTLEAPDDAFRIVNDRPPVVIVDEVLRHVGYTGFVVPG